jgi:hypothetical protein
LSRAFDQYMSGKTPDIPQIRSIRTPSETLANNILQRGPCVYQAANAMNALVLAIHKILRTDELETQAFVNQVLAQMTVWVGGNDGMFGKAIADTASQLRSLQDALQHEPRGSIAIYSVQTEVVVSKGPHGHGIHAHPTLKVIADIAINDANLTFSVSNPRSSWFDSAHIDDSVVAGQAKSYYMKLQNEIGSIKQSQARLDVLQRHETALQRMIAALQQWR